MKDQRKCSECAYSMKDWVCDFNPDHYCSNGEADMYGYNVTDSEACEDFKEREESDGQI